MLFLLKSVNVVSNNILVTSVFLEIANFIKRLNNGYTDRQTHLILVQRPTFFPTKRRQSINVQTLCNDSVYYSRSFACMEVYEG
jgi:hypothetical protein